MNKNILIIGDSWAVPNYYGLPGDSFDSHTEYLLKNLGYNVFNCGINGASNEKSVIFAEEYLYSNLRRENYTHLIHPTAINNLPHTPPKEINLIIWFHTETLRETFEVGHSMDTLLYNGYMKTYEFVKKFISKLNTELIVIGGQSPIYKKLFYNFFNPTFIIEDWRGQLVNFDIDIHWLKESYWIEYCENSLDEKEYMVQLSEKAFHLMEKSNYFPDNLHPGKEAHQLLIDKIKTTLSL